jgi:hypothetical protein
MNPQFSVFRLLAAMTSFSVAFGFFRQAEMSSGDIRFPLAIFCLILTILFLIPPWGLRNRAEVEEDEFVEELDDFVASETVDDEVDEFAESATIDELKE